MLDSLSSLEALEIAKQLELAITGLLAARKMLGGCRGVRTGGHFQTRPRTSGRVKPGVDRIGQHQRVCRY